MRYYESLYIVNPNYEQGKLDEVMKTVSETISDYGFKIINHLAWGKKRLAYNIQEHKYGSYVLLHFETESLENLDSFERFMVLQKPILRNQTVLLDDKPDKQSEKAPSREEDKKDLTKGNTEEIAKPSDKDQSKDNKDDLKVVDEEVSEPEETEKEETEKEETEPEETEKEETEPEEDQSDKVEENEEDE